MKTVERKGEEKALWLVIGVLAILAVLMVFSSDAEGIITYRDPTTGTSDYDITVNESYINLTIDNRAGDAYDITENESYINTTIDNKLTTIYHNASTASAIRGTVEGELFTTHHNDGNYDSLTFNFTEEAGADGLDLRVNFTGIDSFNGGVIRYYTTDLSGDFPVIQLWSFIDEEWEDYPVLSTSESFATIEQSVYDDTDHIDSGLVRMRIYKKANGNTGNIYYVDWIALISGPGTPAGEETDPFYMQDKPLIFANLTAHRQNITNLWSNATLQDALISALWVNASDQDTRIIALEAGGGGGADQPNIDTANITTNVGPIPVELKIDSNITSANSIGIRPNGDNDDYIQFSSDDTNPKIEAIGGGIFVLETDGGIFQFKASGDTDDFMQISTVSNIPRLSVSGGAVLEITEDFLPDQDNARDLGSATQSWQNGWIQNAWTVGDLIFNYDNTNYRIIEAEKLTNHKLKGLMYVMNNKAVVWIEPDGKLHTTKEIDTNWEGIENITFDDDGGVYKDDKVVRYPIIGSGSETLLSPIYIEKEEYEGDSLINKVVIKPSIQTTTTIPIITVKGTTTTLAEPASGTEAP